ncbi:MAG: methionine gamma-lyase family protein [Firmicutes bacterium]|nr:methionine gamma-lyase family protein [Bacillota bacterium]
MKYEQIDLLQNDFDIEKIRTRLSKGNVKLICIQRSRGYELRESISLEKLKNVIKEIKSINKEVIILVDNCYGEFVDVKEPIELGADLIVRFFDKKFRWRDMSEWGIYSREKRFSKVSCRKAYCTRTSVKKQDQVWE